MIRSLLSSTSSISHCHNSTLYDTCRFHNRCDTVGGLQYVQRYVSMYQGVLGLEILCAASNLMIDPGMRIEKRLHLRLG